MGIRTGLMALGLLAALGVSACSSGGSSGVASGPPQGPRSSPSGATAPTATRTYELGSAAGSYDLPPLNGFSGSFVLPATTVPADTRLELTSSLQAPAGAPLLDGAGRSPQATGTLNIYFYTTIRLSSTVTFPTLPGFSVTLPASVNSTGLQFFYAISNPKPANAAEAQFRTEGPATVSGQTVTFAPSITLLTLQAGQSYTIAFYAISATAAKPTPAPPATGTIYVVNAGYNTLTTYAANGKQTALTITAGLNYPAGVAVDAAGKIYVLNQGNGSVTTYTANGTPITPTITGLSIPVGMAVGANGKIYVANRGNRTVTTYTASGVQTSPTITTGLSIPVGVAVDAADKIYVISQGENDNGILTTYTANGKQTTPTIEGGGLPCCPSGEIAVDAAGKIYIPTTEGYFGGAVTTYTANGNQTTPYIGVGTPTAVAVDAAGKIYVTDLDGTFGPFLITFTAAGVQTTPTITAGMIVPMGVAVH